MGNSSSATNTRKETSTQDVKQFLEQSKKDFEEKFTENSKNTAALKGKQ